MKIVRKLSLVCTRYSDLMQNNYLMTTDCIFCRLTKIHPCLSTVAVHQDFSVRHDAPVLLHLLKIFIHSLLSSAPFSAIFFL